MAYDMYSPPAAPPRETSRTTRDFRVTHDPDSEARLSTTLVHALADVLGIDVTDAETLLADEIDLYSLDTLWGLDADAQPPTGHVAFSAGNTAITVYQDGTLVMTPGSPA